MEHNTTPSYSLCSINICGLSDRSKFMLNKYVDSKGFDIIAVQETGIDQINKLELSNMITIADSNKASNKGTALYMKDCYSLTKINTLCNKSKNIDSAWGLSVIRNHRYIIGTVYVKLNYTQGIEEVINMLNSAHQMTVNLKAEGIILVGDFNARHILWGDSITNQYGRNLRENIDATKFSIITAETPTFLSSNGSSCIDLVIISNNLMEKAEVPVTDIEAELFSGAPARGHVPLITCFRGKPTETSNYTERNSIANINWEKWSSDIEANIQENTEYISSIDDPYELLQYTDRVINEVTKKHGEKKVSTSYSKPYWTRKLSELSNNLRAARKSWLKRNIDPNKDKLVEALNKFEEARKEECQNFILNKTKNLNVVQAQKFWKEFKKLFSPRKKQGVDPLDDGNGGLMTDDVEIEQELFSTFFEGKHLKNQKFDDIFFEEVNKLYEELISSDTNIPHNNEAESLNTDISLQDIINAVKDYQTSGKSADNKEFHSLMFKHFGPYALNLIQKIFNTCLHKKLWIWENAEVIFFKKEGKKSYSTPGAYRPISITSYLGKLLEKIISKRFKGYLLEKSYTDPDQEGFTEGRNTIRYLNRLCLGIRSDIQENKTCICLFIDFEKAFDSIWKRVSSREKLY